MSQLPSMETKISTGSAASNFFAALRTGLSLDGAQNAMFSDLLKQVAPVSLQQTVGKADASVRSTEPNNATTDKRELNVSSDDRAELRSLLQRMKQDADDLRDSVRQAKDAQSNKNETKQASSSTKVGDKKTSVAAKKSSASSEETNNDATAVDTATETDDDTTVSEETGVSEADTVVIKKAQGNEAEDKVTDQLISATGGDKILCDLIKTEQAALSLLQKIFQENSPIAPVDDASVPVEADDMLAMEDAMASTKPADTKSGANILSAKSDNKLIPQDKQELTPDLVEGTESPNATDTQQFASTASSSKVETTTTEKSPAKSNDKFDFLNMFNGANAAGQANNPTTAQSVSKAQAATPDLTVGVETKQTAKISATTGISTTPVITGGVKPAGSYDFASQLSAARAAKGGSVGLPEVVEQVALQLNKQVRDGVEQMTLQLRPAELGRIEIKLEFAADSKVTGTVVADNPATLDLLLKDVGSLQRALQDAGLRADAGSLQFNLRGDGQSGQLNQNANNQQNKNSGSDIYGQNQEDMGGIAAAGLETYYITPGRINIRV